MDGLLPMLCSDKAVITPVTGVCNDTLIGIPRIDVLINVKPVVVELISTEVR